MATSTKEKNCYGCRFYNLLTKYCKLYDNPAVKVENPEDVACICFEERE